MLMSMESLLPSTAVPYYCRILSFAVSELRK